MAKENQEKNQEVASKSSTVNAAAMKRPAAEPAEEGSKSSKISQMAKKSKVEPVKNKAQSGSPSKPARGDDEATVSQAAAASVVPTAEQGSSANLMGLVQLFATSNLLTEEQKEIITDFNHAVSTDGPLENRCTEPDQSLKIKLHEARTVIGSDDGKIYVCVYDFFFLTLFFSLCRSAGERCWGSCPGYAVVEALLRQDDVAENEEIQASEVGAAR